MYRKVPLTPVCPIAPSVEKAREFLIKDTLNLLPKDIPELQQKLLRFLTDGIEDEDVCFFYPELLFEMVNKHWDMLNNRSSENNFQDVRIYSPPSGRQPYRITAIEINSPDLAFLVNSISAEINRQDLLISILNHPVLYVLYDEDGNLKDISKEKKDGYVSSSHIHLQIKSVLSQELCSKLNSDLIRILNDVYIANVDWPSMLSNLQTAKEHIQKCATKVPERELNTYCDFLDYLQNNNFTLLGYREYKFVQDKKGQISSQTIDGSSLGFLRGDKVPAYVNKTSSSLPHDLQIIRKELPAVSVSKTNRLASVHRNVPMDAVSVKVYDDNGEVVGEKLFLGLFTSTTYSRSIESVPYLREKMHKLLEEFNFAKGSHNYKLVRHILERYHRDELFQITVAELKDTVLSIMRLAERQRLALFVRSDKFGRYISCLVYVPKDRFGTELRIAMQRIIEQELGGVCVNFATAMDDSVFARVIYIINVDMEKAPKYDTKRIELLLKEASRTWPERLAITINSSVDDDAESSRLSIKYSNAFPIGYSAHYETRRAVFDIYNCEKVYAENKVVVDLYKPTGIGEKNLRLKIYNPTNPLTLSDVMPILENMGLRAVSELPFKINPHGGQEPIWIHDFLLEISNDSELDELEKVKHHFEHAFTKVWGLEAENDKLNSLIIKTAMNWHEVAILRAYVRYLKQIRYPLGRIYVENSLISNPSISRMLVDLFKSLHRTSLSEQERDELSKDCMNKLNAKLENVTSLDEDRILRAIINLINSTMRTNYFQKNENGHPKHYLTLKIQSSNVPDLPAPRPFMEIFVSSPRMEGVHLRGGKIARGGLRWSDRPEDYRTEILGLMKSQMVKNSVIVPMGSKGGFVLKNLPANGDRKALHEEGVACYKILIRALLDVTDNRKGDKIIPPKDVVRRDGDDPYLVVAADKGTATFSDIANGIARDEYNFWLDDAFASGGSAGYDHKKMGITAKGAWESVKMHFLSFDHDIQKSPFDVVGVGDMGGDVFGNGMLLSDKIRLVGAFNHMHIFCDPDPDTASSFKERKRLFDGVIGWDGYDKSLISKGGMIYNRSDKSIDLTPEIQKRFGIKTKSITPSGLIRAILSAKSDLLWFGGIGTYVKSSKETNSDVGDKANDNLRLNASEIGARVIGEGANLGVTQLGRVEFATNGGKINADFIDNSGGVDCSDHEVNIKILLSKVMSEGSQKMTRESRNDLLEAMTDEISELVLRDNYHQSLAVYMMESHAVQNLSAHNDIISSMERDYGLVRSLEGLPEEDEIQERSRNGKGLTRPELSVLMAYSKINLYNSLLQSDIPDDKNMLGWLSHYFPSPLREKYEKMILSHQLSREIISTSLAGHIINRMGLTFMARVHEKTGAKQCQIVRAYLVVREALCLSNLWGQLQSLEGDASLSAIVSSMRTVSEVCEQSVVRLLLSSKSHAEGCNGASLSNFKFSDDIKLLSGNLAKIVPANMQKQIDKQKKLLKGSNLSDGLSSDLAYVSAMSSSFDIASIACECKADLFVAGQTYFAIGQHFQIDWLRQKAQAIPVINPWKANAIDSILDELYERQSEITAIVLKSDKSKDSLNNWIEKNSDLSERIVSEIKSMKTCDLFDLPMLVIAEQLLRKI